MISANEIKYKSRRGSCISNQQLLLLFLHVAVLPILFLTAAAPAFLLLLCLPSSSTFTFPGGLIMLPKMSGCNRLHTTRKSCVALNSTDIMVVEKKPFSPLSLSLHRPSYGSIPMSDLPWILISFSITLTIFQVVSLTGAPG